MSAEDTGPETLTLGEFALAHDGATTADVRALINRAMGAHTSKARAFGQAFYTRLYWLQHRRDQTIQQYEALAQAGLIIVPGPGPGPGPAPDRTNRSGARDPSGRFACQAAPRSGSGGEDTGQGRDGAW